MSKPQMLVSKTRGATMVEYALLIVAVMLLAAGMYRALGTTVGSNATRANAALGQ